MTTRVPAAVLALLLLLSTAATRAQEGDAKARELARAVWKASGGENWPKVKELHFTFVVENEGQQLAFVQHQWNVAAQTDRVQWKGKDVTVNLAAPAEDEDGKAAYARWVNDSYWLLAPLKVLDSGVKLAYEGPKEVEGVTYETLRLSFESVGLTPTDQYVLYIDPATMLVRAWDYIPKPETVTHGSWENYQELGGLKLAMDHKFGGRLIRFQDVKVVQ